MIYQNLVKNFSLFEGFSIFEKSTSIDLYLILNQVKQQKYLDKKFIDFREQVSQKQGLKLGF